MGARMQKTPVSPVVARRTAYHDHDAPGPRSMTNQNSQALAIAQQNTAHLVTVVLCCTPKNLLMDQSSHVPSLQVIDI